MVAAPILGVMPGMISIAFECPHCGAICRDRLAEPSRKATCASCGWTAAETPFDGTTIPECLVCGSRDLFLRKDFPQRLGVAIVVAGFALSCWTWYHYWLIATFGVLFATALADVILYLVVGVTLVCYRCHAEYRGVGEDSRVRDFDLEVHERYRQEAARRKTFSAGARVSK